MKDKWQEAGVVSVDAGLILLGDPCYWMNKEDYEKEILSSQSFAELEKQTRQIKHKKGHIGRGVLVSSGYGDGVYPVYVKHNKEGRISEVKIVFI